MTATQPSLRRGHGPGGMLARLSLIRWSLWRAYLGNLGEHRARLLLLAVLGGAQSLLLLPTLHLVRYCFDKAIPEHKAGTVVLIGVAILLIRLASSALFLLARLTSVHVAKLTAARLRVVLVEWLYRAPRDYLARHDAAFVQGRIVQETERLDNLSSSLLSSVLPSLLTITVLVTMLAWLNWQLLVIAGVLAPIAWGLGLLAGRWVKREVRAFQHSFEQFNQGISFVVRQMDLTRSRGFEEAEGDAQADRIGRLRRSGVRMAMSFAAHGQLQSTVIGAIGLVVLVAGGLEVIAGRLSIGDLIAFYIGAGFLNGAMGQLTSILPDVLTCDESLARLQALRTGVAPSPYHGREVMRFHGRITLRDVAFRHADAPLLDGVSLDLVPGCNVAIIGPNGSGKTTIVDLILGFHRPDEGVVLADGTPYDRLDLSALRRLIGFVPQRPTFFTGTVAQNLVYGRPGRSPADLVAAAERVGIDGFIRTLPRGYDTSIGEGGVLLSGGEAQRLAIARALVGEPRLLILDEPTNHLDADAVAAIMGRLSSARDDLGILTISHDRAVIALAQSVLRLEGGLLIPHAPCAMPAE